MKLFFVDLETTGTDPDKHGVWQMAGQIWIDGAEVERFDAKFQPLPGKLVAKGALEATKMTMDELRVLPQPRPAFEALKKLLGRHVNKYEKTDKMFFVAYNADFDARFARRWFEDFGDQYFGSWFWWPPIDVATIAGFVLAKSRHELVNFKLGTVAKHMGVEFEGEAHDAQFDVDVTCKIYQDLEKRMLARAA